MPSSPGRRARQQFINSQHPPHHPNAPSSFSSSLAYSAASSWATTNGFSPSDASFIPIVWAGMRNASIIGGKKEENETAEATTHNCTQAVLLTCLHLSHEMALRDVGLFAWTLPHIKDPQGSTMRIMRHYSDQLQDLSPHRSLSIRMSPDPSKASIQHNVQKARLAARSEDYIAIFYAGHGIQEPPTEAGELWCYDRSFEECAENGGGPAEYIPILLFDMLTWAGANTCYVWDSQHAGRFIKAAHTEATEIDSQLRAAAAQDPKVATMHPAIYSERQVHFAACGADETLPRINGLPDDLFTACLVTPLRVALLHHNLQTFPLTSIDDGRYGQRSNEYMTALLQNMSQDLQNRLGGELKAILLTIAWQTLDGKSYQKLFGGSGDVVAGLASGFLLAQRVLSSYRTNPESIPHIPSATSHPLWTTWDMILDNFFEQLPPYFDEERGIWEEELQLVAFMDDQLATMLETERLLFSADGENVQRPPKGLSRLPIICQASFSSTYRGQAIQILDVCLRGLDHSGSTRAIHGGALDTALRLISSDEMDPHAVSIWSSLVRHPTCVAAISSVGRSERFLLYFLDALDSLTRDLNGTKADVRTTCQAAAILATVARSLRPWSAFAQRSLNICTRMLDGDDDLLKQWGALLAAETIVLDCDVKGIYGRLVILTTSRIVENRANAIYALAKWAGSDQMASTEIRTLAEIANRHQREGAPAVRLQQLDLVSSLIAVIKKGTAPLNSSIDSERNHAVDTATLADSLMAFTLDPDAEIADRAIKCQQYLASIKPGDASLKDAQHDPITEADSSDLLQQSKAHLDASLLADFVAVNQDKPGVAGSLDTKTPELRHRQIEDALVLADQQVGLPWKWHLGSVDTQGLWTRVAFHSFLPTALACDGSDQLHLWDWSDPAKRGSIKLECGGHAVTSARFVNELYERVVILSETNFGSVHILASNADEPWAAASVSSFPALRVDPEMKGLKNMVTSWWRDTGRLCAGGRSKVVTMWDCPAESCYQTLTNDTDLGLTALVTEPNAGNLLFGGADGTVKIWDVREQSGLPILQLEQEGGSVLEIGVRLEENRYVSTASQDGSIRITDLRKPATPVVLSKIHPGGIASASFQPHSGLLSAVSLASDSESSWSLHRINGSGIRHVTSDTINFSQGVPYTVMHSLRPFLAIGSGRACDLRGSGVGSGCDADSGSYAFAHRQARYKEEEVLVSVGVDL